MKVGVSLSHLETSGDDCCFSQSEITASWDFMRCCTLGAERWRRNPRCPPLYAFFIMDGSRYQNGWIFEKLPKREGEVILIPKIYVAILGLYNLHRFFLDVFRENCNIIFRIWGQRSFGIFPKIHLFHLSQSKRRTRLHVLCILLDNAEHQLGVLPCGSKIEDWLTVGLPPPWSRPSNQTPFFYNNSYQSVRSRDRDEEHDDVLFEAWLEEDHHQGEDLWRLPGPGVWRRRLPRFQDEYYHGPSLEQTG